MHVCQAITLTSGIMALCLNGSLIPIILTQSSERIGTYKYFLLMYTLNATLLALSQVTTLPNWNVPMNGYIFQSTIDVLPRPIQQVQVMCFVLSYVVNAIVVTWSFVYRLTVIENPKPWVVRPKYLPFVIGGSLIVLIYIGSTCWPIFPCDEVDTSFHQSVHDVIGVNLGHVGYIGGPITIDGYINYGMVVCLLSFTALVIVESSIVLFCWNRIGAKLRALRNIASVQYRFQYRLYFLLSLQTIMPIIFNVTPALVVFTLSLAKIPVSEFVLYCGMVLSFAQVADPIFTVLLVTDYKEALITWKYRFLLRTVAPMNSLYVTSSVAPTTTVITGESRQTYEISSAVTA